ncbi:Endonuclease III [Streptococcus sp. HSISB1]|nr:Endonuclease III [Streptococcus sp. HSISB1]
MRIGRERLKKVLEIIGDMYPDARCELDWQTPFQLLVAVILSAQTTDKAVNKVTPNLWKKYPEIEDLATANLSDVEDCLRAIGLYKIKLRISSKLRVRFCKILMAKFLRHIKN